MLDALQGKIERDLEARGLLESFRREFDAAKDEKVLRRMWRFRRIHRRFGWKFWAVISGGAALDADTEQFWGRIGFAVIQGYGLTETTSLISVNHPFRIGRGSIGKVLGGREVKVDANGEILVRGENIAAGYWQGREVLPISGNEKGGEDDGWFRTGDLGAFDAEGNLYFKGRRKNVIVTPAGMNVYPEDLETLLRREPEVKDCVVVGLERGGNAEPCAVLLLRDERRVKQPRHAAGIVARVNQSLAEYQRMRSWFLWPEADFPRTATGKPRLPEIRAAVEAQWGTGDARRGLASRERRHRGNDRAASGRPGRRGSRPRHKSRERLAFEFARPCRIIGRARRPLPGRLERDAIHGSKDGRRTRKPRARVVARRPCICLSRAGRSAGRSRGFARSSITC